MTMQGVDLSSWQSGIDVSKVPCGFVIEKATQGTSYVNPDCDRVIQQCIRLGKPFGVYHYVDGSGAVAEADYFVNNSRGYIGKAVLAIDWESGDNKAWGNYGYLDTLVARVIERTGVRPMIYAQASVYNQVAPIAKKYNCAIWCAQYASMNATGYQDKGGNEGAYSCAIRQYSSAGRLPGWNGNLDLNKFYGDANAWAKYAGASGTPAPAPAPVAPSIPQIAVDGVIGAATVRRWQSVMGTTVDGVVSNQLAVNYRPALVAVNHNKPYGQSQLVRAVQRAVGVTVDGLLGPQTIRAIQRRLGVVADGVLGRETAKALQRRLNEGRF